MGKDIRTLKLAVALILIGLVALCCAGLGVIGGLIWNFWK